MSSVKIMGIDPGATRCGYSVIQFSFDDEVFSDHQYIASGVFGLKRNDEESYSQYKIRLIKNSADVFQDLFDEHQPELIVFEFLPVTNAGAAAGQRLLAFVVATCGPLLAELNGVPWVEMSAVSVKKEITGQGSATKAQVKNALLKIIPELEQRKKYLADETDALAIPIAWTKRKNNTDT